MIFRYMFSKIIKNKINNIQKKKKNNQILRNIKIMQKNNLSNKDKISLNNNIRDSNIQIINKT